ncbi:chromosome segregation ATPase [Thalassomonas sp. RHCl1]|uniref:chromosome segregation ATPase n=1 Tax=Thalassomonas sp. RHCl1 TaxID=2995320 RepID=UPI00248B07DA|nr:chromosome segregation ATPase [Thalassomonas sp. RHCl1]
MASRFALSTALWGGAVIFVLVCFYGFYEFFQQDKPDVKMSAVFTGQKSHGLSQGLRRIQPKHIVESGFAEKSPPAGQQAALSWAQNTSREIEQASGKTLQALLRRFWRLCTAQDNCPVQLARLHSVLAPGYYQLLENFAELEQVREQLLGAELSAHDSPLEDKIARVKAINEQVWGQDAELLYRDEYALYDFSLQGRELAQLSGVGEFIDGYRQLTSRWQDKLASFDLQTAQAKYEQALSLLPLSFSESQRATARAELAHLYLTPEQAASVQQRAGQVAQQADTVASYQQGLAALNRELAQLRKTTLAHLSLAEWQSYQSQQKYRYRLDFFAN